MAPKLALPGLEGVRKDLERNALRLRNGIKWAAGAEFAPPAPTPSDVVWAEGNVHLRRYRRDTPAKYRIPLLTFVGLVGRSYVFDLWKGNSIVSLQLEHGFDAFVLDWGVPDELDSANTLETYLQGYLPRAIRAVLAETGAPEVNLMTYCMGGCMALHALAAQPDLPVRSLVTVASPVDFRDLGPLIEALRVGQIDPEDVLDASGNLPGAVVRDSFKSRKPTGDLVNYANLWQNLWNDEYLEGHQAIGRWLHDHIPMPGALFKQVVPMWLANNGFVNDSLRLGGRPAPLANISMPVLGVIGVRDDIAHEVSTSALGDVLTGAQVELMRVDAGHASLFSGRKAVKVVMPGVFDWIAGHSEEISDVAS
ncbi:MAG TPA: alpha/beta fold hydrolase [Sporichthya sp.]|nr:alpha/beta fold hydrolase [Sporichthya sp.]